MSRQDILDEDGENRAVRTFLMQYGLPGLTVSAMRTHMQRSDWEGCWPDWVRDAAPGQHLTKAGAQLWIRHLLSLEAAQPAPIPAQTGSAMKFATYSALSGATKQASKDVRDARRNFDAQQTAGNALTDEAKDAGCIKCPRDPSKVCAYCGHDLASRIKTGKDD